MLQDDPQGAPEPAAELSARVARIEAELAQLRQELAHLRAQPPVPQPAATEPLPPQPRTGRMPSFTRVSPPPRPAAEPPQFRTADASPSLESRIGSQLFNRVGIIALLIGMAWFLKLAIDNQWIGPGLRVLVGLGAGVGIVLWSERFRSKGFATFSFSLKAIGTGVLYLSLWASFQLYHLLPAWAALIAMVLVTSWNAAMALLQNAQLLAIYALVGAFATPVLISTGGNHEIFLFSYLLATNAAALWLLAQRPWKRLLFLCFPSTVAYFIAWYVQFWNPAEAGITAFFAILLSAPFVAIPLIAREREGIVEGLLAPLAGATFLALSLYSILQDSGRHSWLPWVALALAALYLLLMQVRRRVVAEAVHLSLAITFLTIAIPLKASGRWITIGWLAEGAALLWVAANLLRDPAQHAVRSVMRWLACAALLLGTARALSAWDDRFVTQPFFNARFVTELTAALALALAASVSWQASRRASQQPFQPGPEPALAAQPPLLGWIEIAAASLIAFNLTVIPAVVREIVTYFGFHATGDAGLAEAATISAWLMLYAALLLVAGFWRRTAFVRWQGLVLLVFTIGKVFLYDMRNLSSGYRVLSFVALGILLMAVSFAYQKDWLGLRETIPPSEPSPEARK